jgi:hypothetical protein
MSFTQKIFSSFHNYADGDTRIGEQNRIWYSSVSNTLRIQLDDTPGGTIVGRGVGGFIQYTDLSAIAGPATAGGSLSFNISNGVFTYAPSLSDRIVSPNGLKTAVIDNTGATTFGGDLIPAVNTYNLGTVEKPWKDIYVSQGSIVIADTDPDVDGVSISNTAKYIVIDRGGLKVTSLDVPNREVFQLDGTGKLLLKSEIPLTTDSAAFEVIGSLLGESLPIVNRGVMIHSSGAVNVPSRIYIDGVGVQTTAPYETAYAAFIGRYARNTVANPQPAQAGDLIVRFGGNAYASTIGLNSTSNVRIDMSATETQSSSGRGSRIEFWTTDIGSVTPTLSVHIDSQGIDLSEAADVTAGITFKNGSILKYWPAVAGNNGKILRTDGTDFFWANETVISGQVLFKGSWDASGNSPTLSTSLPTGVATGWQYIVSVAGTQNINGTGNVTYGTGDQLIYNGSIWIRIPAGQAQVQANWTELNSALPAFIQNKPTLATVATTGSYSDLLNKPSIPAAQVNSDWNATSGLSKIENKPTIPTQYTDTLARAAITLSSNTPTGTTSTLTYSSGAFTFTSAAALVSGTTIKTVNSNSLLGSGDVSVGTVTSVGGTGTVSGITLGGSVSVSGNLTLSGTLSGITNTNLSGTAGITNANLANSTISGVSLGGTLYSLTAGTNVSFSTGSTYNGSQAITVSVATGAGYTLPAATTTTLGGVIIPAVATSGISNTSGTIGLAVTTTTQLGGVKVDGTTITAAAGIISATQYTLPTATTTVLGGVKVDGTSITIDGSGIISATPTTIDAFGSTVTTQSSTLTVDMSSTTSVIFWQPGTAGNRAVTLTNFTAGRRVKIFITPKAANNTFTFTSVTGSQCSNGVNTFVLGGGGVAQSSMMIEVFSTTTAIGGVWIFGYGSQ